MSKRVFKKNILSRGASYLLILPFIPAIRSILRENSPVDLVIFSAGLILTLALIIISNNKPYIRVSDGNLFIYLLYKHKPEIHDLHSVEKAGVISRRALSLKTEGFAPLEIRLGKKEMAELIESLKQEGVSISTAGRNS